MRIHRLRPLVLAALLAAAASLPLPAAAAAAGATQVLQGSTPDTTIFPTNAFTVADARQLTGLRVNLPMPTCTAATSSTCDATALLNQLDGFDTRPRVTIPFSGPIDVATVTADDVQVTGPGGFVTSLTQLVWDPQANVLAGQPVDYLASGATYTITVRHGLRDPQGRSVQTCASECRATFTVESATSELQHLQRALDDGSAYAAAGITDTGIDLTQDGRREVFPAPTVTYIERLDQVYADPTKPLQSSPVPNSATAAVADYAFGSFWVPQYQDATAFMPPVPTTQTPAPFGKRRVGVDIIVPAGTPPAGGWPVAIFGPGFTRSKYDLFLAADLNAAKGIATVATDPAGHGYGPASATVVHQGPLTTRFSSFGQGQDLDGDGTIDASEGVQPTDHKTYNAAGQLVSDTPSPHALAGLRDGLLQTAVNDMALVRALNRGVDVTGDGSVRLGKVTGYYGQSFGGIYGTMLMGTDPKLQVGVLNVGGGPIVEIARLSGFRNLLADVLRVNHPNLLNGGPGLNGFTESMPLRLDPPVTNPYPGATTLQKYLAAAAWYERFGSPDAFAALTRPKHVIYQTAFGDHTVPNPTAGELYRAGGLLDRVSYYRNDKTPTAGFDPHGFLLDPRLAGRDQGQLQVITYLASGGTQVIDPDGPGPVWEVPIANPRNLECLHYPEPQTGAAYTFSAGEC